MKTNQPKEYIAPEIKVVEVLVEQGFAITGHILNNSLMMEKHVVDDVQEW